MKRGTKVIIFLGLLILLIIPLASAGFWSDFKAKITGEAAASLNITIGNSLPAIAFVQAIPDQTPNENGINYTVFNFTATDADGGGTINVSTAEARFQLSGITRVNASCVNTSLSGDDVNFTCTVGMYYFDEADANWVINVTVTDNNNARGINESTKFQYNSFPAMVIYPIALTWVEFGVADTNRESNNSPIIINNTGNGIDLTINVSAFDLQGEEFPTKYIYAANMTVNNQTQGSCTTTQMLNDTSLNVTSSILQRGNNTLNYNNATSGQEGLVFCVTAVNSDLSPQPYSSGASGPWTIDIITS